MAKSPASSNGPFELNRLRELIELMEKHGLTEVCLERGEEKWQLRRGPQEVMHVMPAAGMPQYAAPQAAPSAPAPAQAAAASAPEPKADDTVAVKSPTVGTFYTSPTPDDPPFVSIGSKVQPDTVVCIIEAMKVFNQIPAEVSGTITEILVNNGDPVEFGQPLFRVRPG